MSDPTQVWVVWKQAKSFGTSPSKLLSVKDSYAAYCLDQAVAYFGLTLEAKLAEAGHKPSKGERKTKAAQERILNQVFQPSGGDTKRFADPAAMF